VIDKTYRERESLSLKDKSKEPIFLADSGGQLEVSELWESELELFSKKFRTQLGRGVETQVWTYRVGAVACLALDIGGELQAGNLTIIESGKTEINVEQEVSHDGVIHVIDATDGLLLVDYLLRILNQESIFLPKTIAK
jgi:hypothetical protein